jgi:hypothetical protein
MLPVHISVLLTNFEGGECSVATVRKDRSSRLVGLDPFRCEQRSSRTLVLLYSCPPVLLGNLEGRCSVVVVRKHRCPRTVGIDPFRCEQRSSPRTCSGRVDSFDDDPSRHGRWPRWSRPAGWWEGVYSKRFGVYIHHHLRKPGRMFWPARLGSVD